MDNSAKISRARRNLLKIAGTAAVAIVGATGPAKAQHHHHDGDSSGSCFLRGTLIRTPDGPRAIETLKAGDEVAARFRGVVPIKAIESFTLRGMPGASFGASRPVRIKRNALGEGTPINDLCITASHAIAVNDVLVPIIDLVNGTSIVFEDTESHEALDFFHIELEHHDVLDVQGAACESLRRAAVEPCLPLLSFNGGRSEVKSRLRSALSVLVDRRQPLDIIRDTLEERGLELARAA
jgi:hypothetical protein